MPIIANNLVIGSQQAEQTVKNNISPVIESSDENHTILVVNGKPKKISKKSQYLLDMLNLDEE
jgi:hypothetical protein